MLIGLEVVLLHSVAAATLLFMVREQLAQREVTVTLCVSGGVTCELDVRRIVGGWPVFLLFLVWLASVVAILCVPQELWSSHNCWYCFVLWAVTLIALACSTIPVALVLWFVH